jgi:crossover junction endodeoxyribonuclease RuvC
VGAPRLRILGIDPALRTTGYGAIERCNGRVRLIEAGVVVPRANGTLEERLRELHAAISDVIAQTEPGLVVIEELYTTYKNPRSALLMGHARGVLCLASAQAGVAVRTLGHSHVKRALVGSGTARKEQVNAMVTHLLGLRRAPKPHDVSDALALALAFLHVVDRTGHFRVR